MSETCLEKLNSNLTGACCTNDSNDDKAVCCLTSLATYLNCNLLLFKMFIITLIMLL